MVGCNRTKTVIKVRHVNARMMVVEITIENEIISIMSVYSPQCGCSTKGKDLIKDNLRVEMLKVHRKCVLLGDFNGHVGKDSDQYKGEFKEFGYGQKNVDVEKMLKLADSFKLKIANSWFKKMWSNW